MLAMPVHALLGEGVHWVGSTAPGQTTLVSLNARAVAPYWGRASGCGHVAKRGLCVHLCLELSPWCTGCSSDSATGCGAARFQRRTAKGKDPVFGRTLQCATWRSLKKDFKHQNLQHSQIVGNWCVVFHEQQKDSLCWNVFVPGCKFRTKNYARPQLIQKLNWENPERKSYLYFLSPPSPFTQSTLCMEEPRVVLQTIFHQVSAAASNDLLLHMI